MVYVWLHICSVKGLTKIVSSFKGNAQFVQIMTFGL